MSRVVCVLLVPAAGDPLGLLAEGPCGARPPRAALDWRDHGHRRWRDASDPRYDWPPGTPLALVLAWDGEVVPEGVDRLYRSVDWRPPRCRQIHSIDRLLSGLSHASAEPGHWGGTLVLLDEAGREVAP